MKRTINPILAFPELYTPVSKTRSHSHRDIGFFTKSTESLVVITLEMTIGDEQLVLLGRWIH